MLSQTLRGELQLTQYSLQVSGKLQLTSQGLRQLTPVSRVLYILILPSFAYQKVNENLPKSE